MGAVVALGRLREPVHQVDLAVEVVLHVDRDHLAAPPHDERDRPALGVSQTLDGLHCVVEGVAEERVEVRRPHEVQGGAVGDAAQGDAAYTTAEVASISKPETSDPDGWYAPACDTHRSPFAGRNFEYFSEDPVLGGKICSAEVSGAASNGVYAYVKHFALNDQESYRVQHLMTWADEQVMRECYLRPFEICVKEASYEEKYIADSKGTVATRTTKACTGIMSSFNYIGTEWTGGRKSLLTDVLRDEWGFEGVVITDFNLYGYMDKMASLAAGGDLQLTYSAMTGDIQHADTATVVSQLRRSMHNVLYTVTNSNAMQGLVPGSKVKYGIAPWQYGVYGATAALVGLGAFLGWRSAKKGRALKEQAAGSAVASAPKEPRDDAGAPDE